MQDFKTGKWANKILSLQGNDGSWGNFHTLSATNGKPITTEQALRRLEILGFSIEDECIKRAVEYMSDCLIGKCHIYDREEKCCDWKVFCDLMLATWIRRFTATNDIANDIAVLWSNIITKAFSNGEYSHHDYIESYKTTFGNKPHGGRLTDFVSFYQVSLLKDQLDEQTEALLFEYILNRKKGIYYTYENCIAVLPENFQSRAASRYLGAIELLSQYKKNTHKLAFVAEWLDNQQLCNNTWDMGTVTKDGLYYPLSDRWDEATRIKDCTFRIERILKSIV